MNASPTMCSFCCEFAVYHIPGAPSLACQSVKLKVPVKSNQRPPGQDGAPTPLRSRRIRVIVICEIARNLAKPREDPLHEQMGRARDGNELSSKRYRPKAPPTPRRLLAVARRSRTGTPRPRTRAYVKFPHPFAQNPSRGRGLEFVFAALACR